MAISVQVVLCSVLKIMILIVTCIVLGLIPPAYATGWTAGWMVVLFYTWGGLTILYCVISTVLHVAGSARASSREGSRTSGNMAEVILTCLAIMGWLMMCGTSSSIAQWTIIDTGEIFIWIAGLCLITILLLMALSAFFCLDIIQNKVLEDSGIRREKYSSMANLGPQRQQHTQPYYPQTKQQPPPPLAADTLATTHAAYNRGYQGNMV